MDSGRFLRELPGLFDDFPRSEHPRDRRFAPVLELENLASENVLALLNLAASCLGPDEAYVDVGVYHGASLIAARSAVTRRGVPATKRVADTLPLRRASARSGR